MLRQPSHWHHALNDDKAYDLLKTAFVETALQESVLPSSKRHSPKNGSFLFTTVDNSTWGNCLEGKAYFLDRKDKRKVITLFYYYADGSFRIEPCELIPTPLMFGDEHKLNNYFKTTLNFSFVSSKPVSSTKQISRSESASALGLSSDPLSSTKYKRGAAINKGLQNADPIVQKSIADTTSLFASKNIAHQNDQAVTQNPAGERKEEKLQTIEVKKSGRRWCAIL